MPDDTVVVRVAPAFMAAPNPTAVQAAIVMERHSLVVEHLYMMMAPPFVAAPGVRWRCKRKRNRTGKRHECKLLHPTLLRARDARFFRASLRR
jgi:hypothetical protein